MASPGGRDIMMGVADMKLKSKAKSISATPSNSPPLVKFFNNYVLPVGDYNIPIKPIPVCIQYVKS